MIGTSLEYRGILLDALRTVKFERRAESNGPDYLWSTFRIHFDGVYNPALNAFRLPENQAGPVAVAFASPAIPGDGVNAFPPQTDIAVRDWLMQARGLLIVRNGTAEWLRCPANNPDAVGGIQNNPVFACDANVGPVPVDCSVTQVHGLKTFRVQYTIEAYINEAANFAKPQSVLLSSRWEQQVHIDRDQFETIVTEGSAVFRLDRLIALGANADDFRSYLAPPIPSGFQRVDHHWSLSPDGSELKYRLRDDQQGMTLLPYAIDRGVTHIEATDQMEVDTPGTEDVAGGVINDIAGGRGAWETLFGVLRRAVPHSRKTVGVRVYGNPGSNRRELQRVATHILGIRVQVLAQQMGKKGFLPTLHWRVRHDIASRSVDASVVLLHGPLVTLAQGLASNTDFGFPNDNELGDVATAMPGVAPALPNSKGTRSTNVAALISQALMSPQQVPPAMQVPPKAVDRTPP